MRQILLFSACLLLCGVAKAADHLDSPSVQADGSVDINDLYVFQSPSNPENTVFAMTVNPLAGVLSGTAFNNRAIYEFGIDIDGNAIPDFGYRIYFSAVRRGTQRFVVVDFNGRPLGVGQSGRASRLRGGAMVTAGVFDDPFFFDLNGFNNGLAFTGEDFFAGANVSSIILEVPTNSIPSAQIGVVARTVVRGRQVDRMGRPAINTVLIPGPLKNSFNVSPPVRDLQDFGQNVRQTLLALGNSSERANTLTNILLPDLLTFETGNASGFLNGRRLNDDVIDIALGLLTNGAVTGDGVRGNDKSFLAVFPYLAPSH